MRLNEKMLIVGGVELPGVSGDNYRSTLVPQEKTKEAIDGTLVREWRGLRREISYSIDYLGNAKMRELLAVLRCGRAFRVEYLADDGDLPESGEFVCTKYPEPVAAFARGGVLLWHDVSFVLQSVGLMQNVGSDGA